jgi:hypothetical protein
MGPNFGRPFRALNMCLAWGQNTLCIMGAPPGFGWIGGRGRGPLRTVSLFSLPSLRNQRLPLRTPWVLASGASHFVATWGLWNGMSSQTCSDVFRTCGSRGSQTGWHGPLNRRGGSWCAPYIANFARGCLLNTSVRYGTLPSRSKSGFFFGSSSVKDFRLVIIFTADAVPQMAGVAFVGSMRTLITSSSIAR